MTTTAPSVSVEVQTTAECLQRGEFVSYGYSWWLVEEVRYYNHFVTVKLSAPGSNSFTEMWNKDYPFTARIPTPSYMK